MNPSIVILSYPRSGSSEFQRLIEAFCNDCLSSENSTIINFAEYFNFADPGSWGQIMKLRKALVNTTSSTPTVAKLLEPKISSETNQWALPLKEEISSNFYRRKAFLNEVTLTFDSLKKLVDYYSQQQERRLNQILFLQQHNQPVILKHFITQMHKTIDNDLRFNKLLFSRLHSNNFISIFFYRKNLRDAILSNLIKSHYFDDQNIESAYPMTGHNFNNEMPPLQPLPDLFFKNDRLYGILESYVELLKLYKVHKKNLKYIVSYEDFFIDNKPFVFSYLGHEIDIQEIRQKKQNEYPMNYANKKEDYFANSDQISSMIDEVIKRENLSDVAKELGIIY